STCRQVDPASGACQIFDDSYQCPVAAQPVTTASGCPSNIACIDGNCFDTTYANDPDFAPTISMLEGAREAGVYLDTNNVVVFRGEANSCRDRLIKNCCSSDASGAGMSNQSVFGAGSRYVFDTLMDSQSQDFVRQGLNALMTSDGFGSSTFTSYGVSF